MDGKREKKLSSQVLFEATACPVPRNIRTQEIDRTAEDWEMVEDCILDMLDDEDEFVTLTVGEALHRIRYVQACQFPEGITVQLGIEEGGHTRLVEKTCTEKECLEIFREFYDTASVQNVEAYTPVEFFV